MRSSWLASGVVPLLAVLAEGAWLTVAYLAVQAAIAGQPPLFGILELPLGVGLGMLLVRRRIVDPEERPFSFLAVVIVVGIGGWLVAEPARAALMQGELAAAVAQHPGGWLLLVAFLRGARRPDPAADDRGLTRLVLRGIPLLAVPWLLGQLAEPELRTAFTAAAYVSSLTFASTGFLAAGLARLQEIGRETGVDWRRSRGWLALMAAVIGGVILLALPTGLLLGLPVTTVLLGIMGPLAFVATVLIYVVAYPLAFVAGLVLDLLRSLGVAGGTPAPPAEGPDLRDDLFADPELVELWFVLLGLTWALLALAAFVIVRYWTRHRTRAGGGDPHEERAIVLPERLLPRWKRRGRRVERRSPPVARDAVSAYLAILHEFEDADPALARGTAETPAAHARRLQRSGSGGLSLDLLAADYQLARYAELPLTPAEHRRAIARWRSLRARLSR
jgi:hypothetical protein